LVQPELAVGAVALVGKMASDATERTVKQIVEDSGSGVVKGVAEKVNADTAELAAQDAAEKAKSAALDSAKDEAKIEDATVEVKSTGTATTEVKPKIDEDGKETVAKVSTTVEGAATAIVTAPPETKNGEVVKPGRVISEETVQTSGTATTEMKGDDKLVKEGPSTVTTTNDLTGETKALAQQGSTAVQMEKSGESEPEVTAVAQVDVHELAKEVAQQMTELQAAKPVQSKEKLVEKTISTQKSAAENSLGVAAAKLEADIKNDPVNKPEEINLDPKSTRSLSTDAVESSAVPKEGKVAQSALPKSSEESVLKAEMETKKPANGASSETATVEQVTSPEALKEVKYSGTHTFESQEAVPPTETRIEESPSKEDVLEELGIIHPTIIAPHLDTAKTEPNRAPVEELVTKIFDSSNAENNTLEPSQPPPPFKENTDAETEAAAPAISNGTAIEEPTTKIMEPQTAELNTTVSSQTSQPVATGFEAEAQKATHAAVLAAHASIAELHQSPLPPLLISPIPISTLTDLLPEIDTMQEALLAITKVLTERQSTPPPAPAAAPASSAVPEPVATEHNQIVLAQPSTAAVNKRLSVFGSIGWLFGAGGGGKKRHKKGKSIATSTPASVAPPSGEGASS
jgi:hypothetical protein